MTVSFPFEPNTGGSEQKDTPTPLTVEIDGAEHLVSGSSQREKNWSYIVMMEEEELQEPDSGFEECRTRRCDKEPKGMFDKKTQHWGYIESESTCFVPVNPVCVPQDKWEIREEEDFEDKLLHSCCTAGGSVDQGSPNSKLEYWVYLDDQYNMMDCPATPVTRRPCPFIPAPSAASTLNSVVNPMTSSPVTETCSPISSMRGPTASAWDSIRSTSRSPGCSDRDPVSAAAHLHLLGESLSLIGHHLQETDKEVSISSSLSLLLDSLLCALAPLICLTDEIPELRRCTQHSLASTMENISYMMPGI